MARYETEEAINKRIAELRKEKNKLKKKKKNEAKARQEVIGAWVESFFGEIYSVEILEQVLRKIVLPEKQFEIMKKGNETLQKKFKEKLDAEKAVKKNDADSAVGALDNPGERKAAVLEEEDIPF